MHLTSLSLILPLSFQFSWKCYIRCICVPWKGGGVLVACDGTRGFLGLKWQGSVLCGSFSFPVSMHCMGTIWQFKSCWCSYGSAQFETCCRPTGIEMLMAVLFTDMRKTCRPHCYCKLCDVLIVCACKLALQLSFFGRRQDVFCSTWDNKCKKLQGALQQT